MSPALFRDPRPTLLLALCGLLIASSPLPAQVIQIQVRQNKVILPGGIVQGDEDSEDFGDGQLFSENRKVSNALRSAETELEAIRELEGQARADRLRRTVGALQQVLDLEEDFWFPTDDERSHFRSAKSQSERLIASLPADGLDLYVSDYEPQAKAALAAAVKRNDVAAIEEVTRRYFHTPSGVAAAYRLGCLQLDRAEALAAALLFERVRESGDRRFEPMLSLRAAVAWGRAGLPETSIDTLEDFRAANRGRTIQVGGREVVVYDGRDEALPWLVDVLGVQPGFRQLGREEWTMFRGDPSRTASSRPASPLWREKWRYATIEDPNGDDEKRLVEITNELHRLRKEHEERGQLVAPAMHPIVVDDAVAFRTLHNVRAVRLSDGGLRWRSEAWDKAFDGFLENGIEVAALNNTDPRVRVLIQRQQQQQGKAVTPAQKFLTQRAWRDLTAGTVSSDGKLVYSIEELDFLGGFNNIPTGIVIPGTGSNKSHNKLMAVELDTGMLKWELGGPSGENSLELDGSFFLGPPLPLSGRLYTMLERRGEIQLVMYEITESRDEDGFAKYEPRVRWTQALVAPRYDLSVAPLRRMAGISPSYADGMLVCSTAAGAVVAVDLSRRQLAWGYPYRIANSPDAGGPLVRRIGVIPVNGDDNEDRWLDSAPTIAEGRVVVTPRDSSELHCIDLVTGEAAWAPKPRADGLYVAGVHDGNVIVVGRSQVQAWKLLDGTPAWSDPVPIGMPSGRGVRVGSLYHLPLQEGAIATIDLEEGRLLAKSKSKSGRVPGNLVAANGMLVSLSADQLIAFEPLLAVEARIDSRLEENPNDPAALAERGELRLHRGETESAIDDLEKAIANGAGRDTKEVYVSVLLEGLRLDFGTYRKRADAALALIEEVDQKRAFLRLHAAGLEQVGEFEQAFREYVRLAGLESGQLRLEQTTGRLSVRTDRWIRPRLAQLLADAPADRREEMQKALQAELEEAREEGKPGRLRRLAQAYVRIEADDEARRAFIESLDGKGDALERHLVLDQLRRSDDEETRAFATAELARTALDDDPPRIEDAVVWFDELSGDYAEFACLDGRTGRELVAEWSGREDVERVLAERTPWPATKMKANAQNKNTAVVQNFPLPVEGSAGSELDGWTFELDNSQQHVVGRDEDGRTRWKVAVQLDGHRPRNAQGAFVRIHGHVVVCCLGTYFCAIDPLAEPEAKLLWARGLLEPGDPVVNERLVRLPAGIIRNLTDRYGRPLGTVGAVTSEAVYYTVGTRLYSADVLTGDVLWELRGIPRGAIVRADDDYALLLDDETGRATVLRADDGQQVAMQKIPTGDDRLMVEGRLLLGWTNAGDKRVLALRDVVTQGVKWGIEFDRRSKLSVVAGEEVAVYEPSGKFRVLRIGDGKPVVEADLAKTNTLEEITVLRTPQRYVLFPNDTGGPGVMRVNVGGVGTEVRIVHGVVTAFDRETGETKWSRKIEQQGVPLGQALGVPAIVLTSQRPLQPRVAGQPRVNVNRYKLALLDTRDGTMVLDEAGQRPAVPFTLDARPDEGNMTFSFYRRQVDVTFEEPTTTEEPNAPKKPEEDGGEQ